MSSPKKVKMMNIGPVSGKWLAEIGIESLDDLREIGALRAYLMVKSRGYSVSLNLLYALEGAILECHWAKIPKENRANLLLALDGVNSHEAEY